jgi:thymidylate synthase
MHALKRRFLEEPQGVTSQITAFFIDCHVYTNFIEEFVLIKIANY